MDRVAEYLENAQACRALAGKMPAAQRRQLLDLAAQWERIARDREAALGDGDLPLPDPRPRSPTPPSLRSE
jgi:hypothetical protein